MESTVGSRTLFLPVAQALSQDLKSKSVCFALYTHQEVVCFRILSVNTMDENSILVKVSNCYPSHMGRGNLVQMITLMDHSMSLLNDNEELPREIRKNFRLITSSFKSEGKASKQPAPRSRGTGKGETTRAPEFCGGSRGLQDGEQVEACERENLKSRRLEESLDGADSFPSFTNSETSADTSSSTESLDDDKGSVKHSLNMKNSKFANLNLREDGLPTIGSGQGGVVTMGRSDGEYVAVKRWNGIGKDGLKELENEINVYRLLSEKKDTPSASLCRY